MRFTSTGPFAPAGARLTVAPSRSVTEGVPEASVKRTVVWFVNSNATAPRANGAVTTGSLAPRRIECHSGVANAESWARTRPAGAPVVRTSA